MELMELLLAACFFLVVAAIFTIPLIAMDISSMTIDITNFSQIDTLGIASVVAATTRGLLFYFFSKIHGICLMIEETDIGDDSIKLIRNGSYVIKQTKKLTIDNFIAMSGEPYKASYIDQGTKLVCQCGYEWIENRFPEYAVCPTL